MTDSDQPAENTPRLVESAGQPPLHRTDRKQKSRRLPAGSRSI